MKLFLVTKNKHKLAEAKAVFSEFNIEVEQISEEKSEPEDMTLKEIAEYNAKHFYNKYKKPVIVDDTGVFFKAFENFPGNQAKRYFEKLGYKGLLKKLEGMNREAFFMTVVSFCDGNLKTFEGILNCEADTKVNDIDIDVLPYERILLYNKKPLSSYSREEKNNFSHRAIAFKKLKKWLDKRSNSSI